MQRVLIPFLITLEDQIRYSSLEFLTRTWKKVGSFDFFGNKPAISCINGNVYLEDGNHRAMWFWLNGREYIDVEKVDFNKESFELAINSRPKIFRDNKKNGIYSPVDLSIRIHDSEKYIVSL